MTSTADSEGSPILVLDYDDPLAPTVSADVVIGRARQLRRRRRLATAALIAITMVAVVGLADSLRVTPSAQQSGLELVLGSELYRQHPASYGPVVVDGSVSHWTSVAWIGTDNKFCFGSLSTSSSGPDSKRQALLCAESVGDRLKKRTPFVEKPLFQTFPPPEQAHGRTLAVGLVGSAAATVEVTFRGVKSIARVISLSASIGVYGIWLPIEHLSSYRWSDIGGVVARDEAGKVVAQLP